MLDTLLIGSVVLILVLFIIVFPYNVDWIFRRSDCKKVDEIPGPKLVPFFGNIFHLLVPPEEFLNVLLRLHKQYGSTFRLWVTGFPEIFVTDPEDLEIILSNPNLISKSFDYELLHPWLGTGLLTSDGKKWQSHRKILTPAFHFKILEEYIKTFNNNSHILVDMLESQVSKPYVNISSYVTMCTLDIICETAMGVSINAQLEGDSDYVRAVKRISKIVVQRQLKPWYYRDFVFNISPLGHENVKVLKTLHDFTNQVIKERREEYMNNIQRKEYFSQKRRRLAFLDLLMEVSVQEGLLTDAEIREEVDTFMFEGHDTTSVAISWALYFLGAHPDVQAKAVDELTSIFGDSDRDATYADLNKMKYLEQIIKETLRLYPSVPGFSRTLDVDVKIKNYTLPARSQVPIVPFIIHRNPVVFPNPEDFNPDNFLPEKVVGRHPFSYIPFSAGPRNCIGQRFALLEEKAVLSSVLRKLKLESLDSREDIPVLMELILRPKKWT